MSSKESDSESLWGLDFGAAVLEAFLLFPRQQNRIDTLIDRVTHEIYEKGWGELLSVRVTWETEGQPSISIYLKGMGDIDKYFDGVNEINKDVYRIMWYRDEQSHHYNYESYDRVNDDLKLIIPFMASLGKDISDIPLLINTVPEFAKAALEYIPFV